MSRTLRVIIFLKPVGDLLRTAAVTRLLARPAAEQKLLLRALTIVALIRSALWFIPLTRLQRLLNRPSRKISLVTEADARMLSWAVRAAAERIPGATCLTRALALQVLLRRSGSASRLRVGFKKNEDGTVDGHAWLEWRGIVLIGGEESSDFTAITPHAADHIRNSWT